MTGIKGAGGTQGPKDIKGSGDAANVANKSASGIAELANVSKTRNSNSAQVSTNVGSSILEAAGSTGAAQALAA